MSDTDAKAEAEAEAYWENLLGFKVDPWLGISSSALKECYAALGVVSARWNSSENMMRLFIGHYIQLPEKLAPAIMRHFNNITLVDLLADGAAALEKDNPKFLEALNFLCALYSLCRENRNDIIHGSLSLNIAKRTADRIVKPSTQRNKQERVFSCELKDIKRIADDIDHLNNLMMNLIYALDCRKDPTKYTHHTVDDFLKRCKFPLPDKLTPLPPERLGGVPPQPQSPPT